MKPPAPADIHLDPDETRAPPRRSGQWWPIAAGLFVGLATMAGWVWWSQQPPLEPVATASLPAPAREEPPTPPPLPSDPHDTDPAVDSAPLQAHEIPAALARFLGRQASAVQTDDFPRRFVATLDNLGREHASAQLWPVMPMPGRFTVEEGSAGQLVIAASNARRYTAFVAFASGLDSTAAVQLYVRMLPLLQQAYAQIGFPGRSFNGRVVAVIDQLLATPQLAQPPRVLLMEVKGPIASTRPWVRYEFADPALESLSAGQKMLLRMGPVNARRLKQKLAELRGELRRVSQGNR